MPKAFDNRPATPASQAVTEQFTATANSSTWGSEPAWNPDPAPQPPLTPAPVRVLPDPPGPLDTRVRIEIDVTGTRYSTASALVSIVQQVTQTILGTPDLGLGRLIAVPVEDKPTDPKPKP